jgi:hypothetical protein
MRVFVWSGLADFPGTANAGALLWALGAGLVFLAMAVLVYRLSTSPSPGNWDAIIGITLTAMLVLSPLSWVYYLPLLIVPVIVAMRCGSPAVRLLVSVGWLLCAIPFNQEPLGEVSTLQIFTFQGGFAAWGLLATTAGMFLVAREAHASAPAGRSLSPERADSLPAADPRGRIPSWVYSALSTWIGSTRVAR